MSDYEKQLESENEELRERLAKSERSYASFKAFTEFIEANCNATWEVVNTPKGNIRKYINVKSYATIKDSDMKIAKDEFPEVYDVFCRFANKADIDLANMMENKQ